jgi:hypothetical protein
VPRGWQINTALVERVNLSLRQHVAASGRRTSTLGKGEAGLRQQLARYHVYYNFVLPPASLRLPHASLRQAWPSQALPMGAVRPRCGGRVRRPWQRD